MAKLVCRDRTSKFKELRARYRLSDNFSSDRYGGSRGHGSQSDEKLLGNYDPGMRGHPVKLALPPIWVETVEELNKDIQTTEKDLKKLKRLHQERLKVSFNDEDEKTQDRDIEVLTQGMTRTLKKCEQRLKKIATQGNVKDLPYEERVVRLNVMRSKASLVQVLSNTFRTTQKSFLDNLKKSRTHSVKNEAFFDDFENDGLDELTDQIHAAIDKGLSPQHLQQLQEREQNASQREKEIIAIAKSVNELAEIFRELSVLVIQQGTILDRIDYNVEQTVVQLKGAKQELQKSEKYQKKNKTTMCIMILIVCIAIAALILIFNKSG